MSEYFLVYNFVTLCALKCQCSMEYRARNMKTYAYLDLPWRAHWYVHWWITKWMWFIIS